MNPEPLSIPNSIGFPILSALILLPLAWALVLTLLALMVLRGRRDRLQVA